MNQHHLPRSFWYAVYVAILVALGFGIWGMSQRIHYDWNWKDVAQNLVSTSGQELLSPFDAYVTITPDGKRLSLKEYGGDKTQTYTEFDEAYAETGDLVFRGDLLAYQKGLRAGILLVGLWMTLKLSAVSLVFALALGLIAGLGRVADNPAAKQLSTTYVEIIRGTPLLVQIFIMYFFIGTVLQLSAFTAGVAALAVFTGAYIAEIVRSGIESVPKGQMEAARSLGMNYRQAMTHVILPQALKKTLPSLAGQFINLIKDSSLVSVMALTDLTKAGREIISSNFRPFEVWFTVALMYLLLTGTLSWLVRRLEKRLAHD
ncbi:amino acid ABC transporter permease [Hydrocarboniphaga sp.]|uniref:amino acid ABC transporter permease n=1 Tax=Hydrocarboniphaga sp. TaxID=2033016 RepID=UPI003D11EB5B